MSVNHDFNRKDHVRQYPSLFVSSRPSYPKDRTSNSVPHLDLRWETNNEPQDEPEVSGIVNENSRIYER